MKIYSVSFTRIQSVTTRLYCLIRTITRNKNILIRILPPKKEDYSEDPDEISTDVERSQTGGLPLLCVKFLFVLPSGPVRVGAALGLLNLCGSLVITMRRMVVTRMKAMVKKKEEEEAWY